MRSQLVKVSTSAPAVPVPVSSVLRPVLIRIGVYRFFVSTSGQLQLVFSGSFLQSGASKRAGFGHLAVTLSMQSRSQR